MSQSIPEVAGHVKPLIDFFIARPGAGERCAGPVRRGCESGLKRFWKDCVAAGRTSNQTRITDNAIRAKRFIPQSTRIHAMKTKTLLIVAVIFAAGFAVARAQINQTFEVGLNFCAPPLPGANMSAEVMLASSLHSGDQVLTWTDNVGYTFYYFNEPGDWYDGITFEPVQAPVLVMGKGFVYQNNSGGPEVNTYTGTPLTSGSEPLAVGGPHFIGSFIPMTAAADVVLASCLTSGDVLYLWRGNGFEPAYYNGPDDWYDNITFDQIPTPVLTPGEGFFYWNNSSGTETFAQ
jgi:hypothetical protein